MRLDYIYVIYYIIIAFLEERSAPKSLAVWEGYWTGILFSLGFLPGLSPRFWGLDSAPYRVPELLPAAPQEIACTPEERKTISHLTPSWTDFASLSICITSSNITRPPKRRHCRVLLAALKVNVSLVASRLVYVCKTSKRPFATKNMGLVLPEFFVLGQISIASLTPLGHHRSVVHDHHEVGVKHQNLFWHDTLYIKGNSPAGELHAVCCEPRLDHCEDVCNAFLVQQMSLVSCLIWRIAKDLHRLYIGDPQRD